MLFRSETWSTWLDPTKNPPEERPWGSKALLFACKDHKFLKSFSARNRIRREMYDHLSKRWKELGLDGTPEKILSFEDSNTLTPIQFTTKDGSFPSGGMSM